MTIGALVGALQRIGLETDFEDLRAILWLAERIQRPPAPARRPAGNAAATPDPAKRETTPVPLPPDDSAQAEQVHQDVGRMEEAEPVRLFPDKPGQGAAARPIRVRGVAALPQSLAIGRALRPVLRRRAGHDVVMDEQATAEHVAESGFHTVVYRPVRERWFDVVVVAEQMATMVAWQPVLREFERLLHRVGCFRSVRGVQLDTGAAGPVVLHANGKPLRAASLRNRGGRSLVLLLSDCTSAAWHDGRIGAWLASIAAEAPVAIGQYLPQSLWPNTATGFAELRARAPGLATVTRRLDVRRPGWALGEPGVAVPVFALTPPMILAWARMTVGAGHAWATATLVPLADGSGAPPPARPDGAGADPEARLRRFRAFADRDAQLLAAYCAAVRPLTAAVLRVIQRALAPDSGPVALAQVVLGGLLVPVTDAAQARRDPDNAEYDFHPGLRALLETALTERDVLRVNLALYDYLVQLTGTPFDFTALLADPRGRERLPEAALPFAQFARRGADRFAATGTGRRRRIGVGALIVVQRSGGFTFSHAGSAGTHKWDVDAPGIKEDVLETLADAFVGGDIGDAGRQVADQLVPAALVAFLAAQPSEDLCELVVDKRTARYPWELLFSLAERGTASSMLRRGMTRRLALPARAREPADLGGGALVIGLTRDDATIRVAGPHVDTGILVGLRSLVAGEVRLVDQEHAADVIFDHPWRIVHLLDLDPAASPRRGWLNDIDNLVFRALTQGLLQLDPMPDLFFLDHALARGLAPRLVERGARVVIALPQGMADRDKAAFARTLYDGLRSGGSLVEVVRMARQAGAEGTGGGARIVECYGNPDWRYVRDHPAQAGAPRLLRLLVTGVDQRSRWFVEGVRKKFAQRSDIHVDFLPRHAGRAEQAALFRDAWPSLADWDAILCVIAGETDDEAPDGAGVDPHLPSTQESVYLEALRQGKDVAGFIRATDAQSLRDKSTADVAAKGVSFARRLSQEQFVTHVRSRAELVAAVARHVQALRQELDTYGAIAPKRRSAAAESERGLPTGECWVLVAGTGLKSSLGKKTARTCEALGAQLAHSGFNLITGGWRGVDEATARSFSSTLEDLDISVDSALLQVVPRQKRAAFDQGRILYVDKGDAEYREAVERAAYLVVIGGYGGAGETAHFAFRSGCTVLPLADTGGDARRLHALIRAQAPSERQPFVTDAVLQDLLAGAPGVGAAVVQTIVELERLRARAVVVS